MRIAIIGAGWTGCHLAATLMNEHDITLLDKEDRPFCGTSQVNQNRLHLGYHYARNKATRDMCKATFSRFMDDYGHLTNEVKNNLYAVPKAESLLDYGTIAQIFDGWGHEEISAPFLIQTEGVMRTNERFISPIAAQRFFSEMLEHCFEQQQVEWSDVPLLKSDYHLVIDCTNNTLLHPSIGDYFEAVAMFLYKKKKPMPFDALTYIDGPLFSFYPYEHDLVSFSHVEDSVIQAAVKPIACYPQSTTKLKEARERAELHAKLYWPGMDKYLQFEEAVISMKSKRESASAYRAPLFRQQGNLLSIFTGKIQGIYAIEERVREVIRAYK